MSRRLTGLVAQAVESLKEEQAAAALPQQPGDEAPAEALKNNFIQRKISGIQESARLMKKPIIRLKPSECSIWEGNARDYALLDYERLKDLIDSILAQGGNSVPAVVRRTSNPEQPYQVVVGTRRHWAINWLNNNSYPQIEFTAIIEDIDDEAAFRLADIENRERQDVSDMERAKNYKHALDTYYDGRQSRMVERLKISSSHLSRLIALADTPAYIATAFAHPNDIGLAITKDLLPLLKDPLAQERVKKAATDIAAQQSFRQAEGESLLKFPDVLSQLVTAAKQARGGRPKSEPKLVEIGDRVIARVDRDIARKGLTLTITPEAMDDIDVILDAIRPIIAEARFRRGK
jgi:ParB family chromosome partitioning protein